VNGAPSAVARMLACGDAVVHAWLRAPRALHWAAVAAVMAALWWSSSRQPTGAPPNVAGALLHNALHLVAFGALAFVVWCAVRPRGPGPAPRAAAIAFVLAVAYGVIDEVHQSFVPGRVCTLSDIATDACGALLVLWAARVRIDGAPGRVAHAVLLLAVAAACVCVATFAPW
jgi:VanZ family protein